MKTKTLSRIANVSFAIAIISALSVAVFASPLAQAKATQGEPTLKETTSCAQYIFNTNQLVEANKLTLSKAEERTKYCKALISRYEARLNKGSKEGAVNNTGNNSMCYLYGTHGGIKEFAVKAYLRDALKTYDKSDHLYYVGVAIGTLDTTMTYTGETKRRAALNLYVANCIKSIKGLNK